MAKGKRYEEGSLNYKKVFAVIIAIVVVIMFIIIVKNLVEKGKDQKNTIPVEYYALYQDDKWGVINTLDEIVIEPMYQEMITVLDKEKDVFLCTYDVNEENGESHYYAESKNIIVKTIRKLGMDIDNIDEAVLAMHLNMTVGRLHSILEKTLHKKKVELIEEDGETSQKYTDPPETAFMKKEAQNEFRECLNELDEVENIVLCMHFGFYYPKFNEDAKIYKLSEIQRVLNKAGYETNAINEYRAARRHIADILYKKGIVGQRNRYQSAKEEIGLKFKDADSADDLFNALNDIEDI